MPSIACPILPFLLSHISCVASERVAGNSTDRSRQVQQTHTY